MSNIQEKIDNFLELLENGTSELKNNVKKLANDIESIQDSIFNDTKESYGEIKESIMTLKKLVSDTELRIGTLDEAEFRERSGLKARYFSTFIDIKNEVMNFDVNNTDRILDAFDDYANARNEFYDKIEECYKENIEFADSIKDDIEKIIADTLEKEIGIYAFYEKELRTLFQNTISETQRISNLYYSIIDDYQEKVRIARDRYESEKMTILGGFPQLIDILAKDVDGRKEIGKALDSVSETIKNEYEAKQKKNFDEFKRESDEEIKHMEKVLEKTLGLEGIHENKEAVLDSIKEEIRSGKVSKELITKLEHAEDKESIEDCVTEIYSTIHSDTYEKYRQKEYDLEKEYLNDAIKARNNRLVTRYLSDVSIEDALVENNLNMAESVKKVDRLFKEYIIYRTVLSNEMLLKTNKLSDSLRKLLISYSYSTLVISSSIKRDLDSEKNALERKLALLKVRLDKRISYNKNFYNNLYKYGERELRDMKYLMDTNRIHRNYVTTRGILLISSRLYKTSRELDLLEPRYKLEKIISEYDVQRKSLEDAYSANIKMLDRSKVREELAGLENYKFALAFLEHRTLSAGLLIDLTHAEYKLRIDVLNEIRETSKSYNDHTINRLISKYMDSLKEMNCLKEIDLNSLLQTIEKYGNNTAELKQLNTEKMNEIMSKYQDITDKIHYLMKNDPDITEAKSNIENFDLTIFDAMDRAMKIRDASLIESVKSLKNVDTHFIETITSLNEIRTIDYVQAFNDYKLQYILELNRINDNLDEKSKLPIEEINAVARHYLKDWYIEEYKRLTQEHHDKINELYKEYILDLDNTSNSKTIIEVSENNTEEYYGKLIESIDAKALKNEKTIHNNFSEKKKELDVNFAKDIEASSELLKNREIEIKKEYDESIKINENKFLAIEETEKEYLKDLEVIRKKLKSIYSFEYEAFENTTKDRLKNASKNLEEKYKKPTVYQLQGKEKED